MRELGRFGSERFAEFKVARVEERLRAVVGQQHGGTETVAGRIDREPQAAEIDRLAILHFEGAIAIAEAMLIERGGCGRSER